MTAELLGLPQANVVTKLEIGEGAGTALREIEGGIEKVVFTLPAVVSAQKGLNEPRYETLKGHHGRQEEGDPGCYARGARAWARRARAQGRRSRAWTSRRRARPARSFTGDAGRDGP